MRPTGVTVLGILAILAGCIFLGLGLLFLLGSNFLVRYTGMPHYIASIAVAATAGFLSLAVLEFIIAFGLLSLANWARILTIVCAIISLIGAAMGILRGMMGLNFFPLPRHIVTAVIDVLILWYLTRPDVKQAFLPAPQVPPAAPTERPAPVA